MRSSLARSASVAVTCILAGGILVGCGSTQSVPDKASSVLQTNVRHPSEVGAQVQLSRLKLSGLGGEVLKHTTTLQSIGCGVGYDVTFFTHPGGTASGPFPGTFKANGSWQSTGKHVGRLTKFSETFTIVSGSSTITGSLKWNGKRVTTFCEYFHPGFNEGIGASSQFKYTATLTQGGVVVWKFSGHASEGGIRCNDYHTCRDFKFPDGYFGDQTLY
jgi:hypothetical protein